MAGESAATIGGSLACVLLMALVFSFSQISPTEMALRYNWVMQTVDQQVYSDAGLYFLGPFTTFVKYPKTIQILEFDRTHNAALDGRTKDGLPILLALSFQYRLIPSELYQLYHEYGNDYVQMYERMGTHIITEQATNFTAYKFLEDKQDIAIQICAALNTFFMAHLHATVETMQLNEDDLPPSFADAVQQAATTNRNISKMFKVRESSIVSMDTEILVAKGRANATLATAEGEVKRILAEGGAAAEITATYIDAEAEAYALAKEKLNMNADSLLDYIWYDNIGGGGVAGNGQMGGKMEVLVGVNPAAYISAQQ